jgi:hypothetical protein
MGMDWTSDRVDNWVFVDEPLIVVVRLQDEEEEDRTEPERGGKVEDLEEEEGADAVVDTGI